MSRLLANRLSCFYTYMSHRYRKIFRFLIILGGFFVLLNLDSTIQAFVHTLKTIKNIKTVKYITYLGDGSGQIFLFLLFLAGGYFYKRERLKKLGKIGIYTLIGSGLVTQTLKWLIRRPRPNTSIEKLLMGPRDLEDLSGHFGSFPSGHALSSSAVATVLIAFYPKLRYPLYVLVLLISLSRIYLEYHFASDVYAGIILGWWIGRGCMFYFLTQPGDNPMGSYRSFLKKLQAYKAYLIIPGLILFSGFLFFYGLTGFTLFDVDEAVFSEATREMMETGNWITPQYNYSNRYDKPILFYWLMALSYKLFGVNEFGARFWSPTMAVALVIMTFYFLRRTMDIQVALLGALILSTCLEMYYLSHVAVTDMTLCFFITAALYTFFLGHQSSNETKKWWYRSCYIFMALATLTKGPIGVVLPLLAVVPFLIATDTWRQTLKEGRIFSGILLFLAVTGPWYILEIAINGWDYINKFFIFHNVTRYLAPDRGHKGPIYFYLGIILVGFFPWSTFLPHALSRVISTRIGELKRSAKIDPLSFLATSWFFTTLLFFTFAKTKLPNYVLPLFPAMAILTGRWWSDYLSEELKGVRGIKISRLILGLTSLSLALIFGMTPFILSKLAEKYPGRFMESLDIRLGCWLLAGTFLIGGIGGTLTLTKFKRTSFGILVLTMILVNIITLTAIVPPVNAYFQGSLHDLANMVRTQIRPDGKLVVYGKLDNPSIAFYSQHGFIKTRSKEELKSLVQLPQQVLIITKTPLALELQKETGIFLWRERQGYALLSNQPL
ncbi:MAG TPA: phosphatase PAP2 family protein [Candidatus Limnocylindrales bacterium]|nr:phosphatase PAP2 family protein [Candidatus Limnocylindrales bacterium]